MLYLGFPGFYESGYQDAAQPNLGLSVFLPQLLQSPDIRYVPPYPTHLPSAQRVFVLESIYLSAKVPVSEATSEAAWLATIVCELSLRSSGGWKITSD